MSKKILILGHARHGKDTVAEYITELEPDLKFASSSLFAGEKAVIPVLGPMYNYKDVNEAYEDRLNHRQEWFELIKEYNKDDPARLARELLEDHDIYVGMRSNTEYQACVEEGLFDLIIWVDASSRCAPEPRESFNIQYNPFKMHYLSNNSSDEAGVLTPLYNILALNDII